MRRLVAVALCAAMAPACAPLSPELELHGPVPSPSDGEAFDVALFQSTGARLSRGHRWHIENSGRVFAAIVDDIGRAHTSVDIVSYIWHSGEPSDRIVAALEKRAHGVTCRILVDPLGSPDFEKNVQPRLRAAGCTTLFFRPLGSHPIPERDHRKLTIVDGRIGFVGGYGIRQEWVKAAGSRDPEWRDINIRIEGPAVNELQRAFAQNWQEAGGTLLPVEDFPRIEPDGDARIAFVASSFALVTEADRLTQLTIQSAKKRLWIWNAYFTPDSHLRDLLIARAKAGVDVRVLAPGDKNDVTVSKVAQRRTYARLLAGGVRIWEYQPSMMHAKAMIIDDRVAVIGSINLDSLSLTRLEEDAIVVDDPALVDAMAHDWGGDIANSREVH